MTGKIYGLGLGPGDPELVTMKTVRLIQTLPVIAYPESQRGPSFARRIAAQYIPETATELKLHTPMVIESAVAQAEYDKQADIIAEHLDAGRDVGLLCEGDPFLFGSFMYLYDRLMDRYDVEVVPGVTSVTAAAAAAGTPLCSREDVMTVLAGTLEEEELERQLSMTNSAVIMKVGRHLPKIRKIIDKLGCLQSSVYVERALNPDQKVMGLSRLDEDIAPYFSIILFFRDSE